MIEVPERLRVQGTYLNIIKACYIKSIGNIDLERLKGFFMKIKSRTRLSTIFILNSVFEVLAKTIRQLNEIKHIQICTEEVKISLYLDEIIVFISDTKFPPGNSYSWWTLSAMYQDKKKLMNKISSLPIHKGQMDWERN